jgi:hypothetical protein
MGMGKDDAHRRRGEEGDQEVTVVSMDYCYLHEDQKARKVRKVEEKEGRLREIDEMPVLVMVDRRSKMIMGRLCRGRELTSLLWEEGRK